MNQQTMSVILDGAHRCCRYRTGGALVFSRWFSSSRHRTTTALYEWHVQQGGKMVDFAGYALPMQYGKHGVLSSHLHTRHNASLFDVSHMGQVRVHGPDRIAFLESVLVGDLKELDIGASQLSLLTTTSGGILDDCVLTIGSDHVDLVLNASNKEQDLRHMTEHKYNFDVELEPRNDMALLAVQGPSAMSVWNTLVPDFPTNLPFMHSVSQDHIPGLPPDLSLQVTRCGYTGEDGIEISVPNAYVLPVVESLLQDDRLLPAGLAARDSLRLEAGLCLHGQDISIETTPVEAALSWTIGKRQRLEKNFLGAEVILSQLTSKSNTKKRVGLRMPKGTPPARAGTVVLSSEGEEVGRVTSGTMSPCLQHPIAMAYVNRGHFKKGNTALQVIVRKKHYPCEVTSMPFVPSKYYK